MFRDFGKLSKGTISKSSSPKLRRECINARRTCATLQIQWKPETSKVKMLSLEETIQ
jgi:hypothetical protein